MPTTNSKELLILPICYQPINQPFDILEGTAKIKSKGLGRGSERFFLLNTNTQKHKQRCGRYRSVPYPQVFVRQKQRQHVQTCKHFGWIGVAPSSDDVLFSSSPNCCIVKKIKKWKYLGCYHMNTFYYSRAGFDYCIQMSNIWVLLHGSRSVKARTEGFVIVLQLAVYATTLQPSAVAPYTMVYDITIAYWYILVRVIAVFSGWCSSKMLRLVFTRFNYSCSSSP